MNARIDDLLHRLTPAKQIALLHQFQPAISRLGMPVFKTAMAPVAVASDRHDMYLVFHGSFSISTFTVD